ncbi:hypothetical protein OG905_09305 [Streptomyces sp. NBC_00322]|uniref:IclR family transcriptional regulator domain-containing protein n=1 Tax=Streptomyces sp. NBC_00322 TaxID=2975712 RepID=UPI002E29B6A9|nr:IclR family transcriptional regulator C-terminal domain-containing protein [Streptomyces sp. NBC_00322]
MFDAEDELVEARTANAFGADPRAAPNSPRHLGELSARLRKERQQGYAVASEEVEVGLTSVGVPVRSRHGHILAVLKVSGPTPRMSNRVESLAKLLIYGVRRG